MSIAVPLIRGFALLPTLRWLAGEGVAAEDVLEAAGLPVSVLSDPFRPVPLLRVASLLRDAAAQFGPDLPCQVLAGSEDLEIAMLGKVAVGARTPRDAFGRIVAALPYYCSHEQVSVEHQHGRYVVREFFACKFDPVTRHTILQYAAAMMARVLAMSGERHGIARLEIPPHPTYGIAHLERWFGDRVVETRARGITVVVDERTMEHPFDRVGRERLGSRGLSDREPLRGDGTSVGSLRAFLASMIESDQVPTIRSVAAASGTSPRSLQRRLDDEGTSFSELLADVRQSEALKRFGEHDATLAAIAADLGYSDQAAFTRAFRRWTGSTPGRFRVRSM